VPNIVQVVARTAKKDNLAHGGSECKFYRTYALDVGSLFQWGSARGGNSGGQFKNTPSRYDAATQFQTKCNEGYVPEHPDFVFDVDLDKLQQQGGLGSKNGRIFLENIFHAAFNRAPQAPTGSSFASKSKPETVTLQDPTPVAAERVFDRMNQASEKVLAAISQAATDPAGALTTYSLLGDEIEALENDLRKVKSYMSTLEVMVDEALA
jgi:hypothetical protein